MQTIDEGDALERKRRIGIAQECGGILAYAEAFYVQSILYEATASREAFQRFACAVVRDDPPAIIVSAIQEALTHAAGLSRYFWPSTTKGVTPARAKRLRELYKVEETSPLHDRALRNALEHFDERLDEYLLRDIAGIILTDPLVEPHTIADEAIGHVFRAVDPWEGIFILLSEKFEFFPVMDEVEQILTRGASDRASRVE